MKRREFLQKAGIGSVALASLPTLVGGMTTSASGSSVKRTFTFVEVSGPAPNGDLVILDGRGQVNGNEVEGRGNFTHVTAGFSSIVAFGTWRARELINFVDTGTFGAHAAGRIEMEVELRPAAGGKIPATMTVVCDLPGLNAPGTEGVELVVGAATFPASGSPGVLLST